MAKKQRTEGAAKNSFIRICSFIGILISAVVFVVAGILSWFGGNLGTIGSILNLVAALAMLVAVAFPAWDYVKYKSTGWKVVYWVALVIYVFGCVFGMIPLFR